MASSVISCATLKGKDGDVDTKTLDDCELVGIYFSAHWCPPCRGFTPALAECYKKVKAAGKKFEIVFVSSDRDDASFNEYFNEMPWVALPFADRDVKEALATKYSVRGIPTLILIDPKTGETKREDGRAAVAGDPEGANFPWSS